MSSETRCKGNIFFRKNGGGVKWDKWVFLKDKRLHEMGLSGIVTAWCESESVCCFADKLTLLKCRKAVRRHSISCLLNSCAKSMIC